MRELLSDTAMDVLDASRAEKAGAAKGRQILVIEDDKSIVELIKEIVSLLGFDVIAAENADEAISEFEECSDSAACVILDYGIPGMDASRLLSRLREIDSGVKVVVSSGYSQSFIARDFPLDTVSAFIAKPYEPQLLVDALTKVVEGNA